MYMLYYLLNFVIYKKNYYIFKYFIIKLVLIQTAIHLGDNSYTPLVAQDFIQGHSRQSSATLVLRLYVLIIVCFSI